MSDTIRNLIRYGREGMGRRSYPKDLQKYWDSIAEARLRYKYEDTQNICFEYSKIVIREFLKDFIQLEGKKIFKSDLWEEAIDLERSFCKDKEIVQ